MGEPCAVLGVGIATPSGNDIEPFWAEVLAGQPSAQRLTFDGREALDVLASCVELDPLDVLKPHEVRRTDRVHHLAFWAADRALRSAAIELPEATRRAIVVGVGNGATAFAEHQYRLLSQRGLRAVSPLTIPVVMPNTVAAHLSMRHDFRGPAVTVTTACASGADAIGEALWLLRNDRADLVLAGGVDALLTAGVVAFFCRTEAMSTNLGDPAHASRPFDVDRDGFVIGEGAGFVVVVRVTDATERFGLVRGYAASSDAYHLVAAPEDGRGAVTCMRAALADADLGPSDIGHINAHGTSTVRNDLVEAVALRTVFGAPPPATATKGSTGHLVGASGAVEAIATLLAARNRQVPPIGGLRNLDPAIDLDAVTAIPRPVTRTCGLSNSFAFGGHNASLVLDV